MYRPVPTSELSDDGEAPRTTPLRPWRLLALVVIAIVGVLCLAVALVRGRARPALAGADVRAALGLSVAASPPTAVPLSLPALRGSWRLGLPQTTSKGASSHEVPALAVDGQGRVLLEGSSQESKWHLVQDPNGTIFSHRRRADGWVLDRARSSLDVLVWRREGQGVELWYRERYDSYSDKDVAIEALGLQPDADPCNALEVTCDGGRITKIALSSPQTVQGRDVALFGRLPRLRVLDLSHSKVEGNIGSLAELRHLEVLDLRDTEVAGDIASVGAMPSLLALRLGGASSKSKIYGDLSDLRGLASLTELDISAAMGVSGDVAALAGLRHLEVLRLGRTQASGNLSALAALPRLREASLEFSGVVGDIGSLAPLSASLEHLDLRGDRVEVTVSYARTVSATADDESFGHDFGAVFDWRHMTIDRIVERGRGLGWQPGDRLVAINSEPVHRREEAMQELSRVPKDELPIAVALERGVFGDISALAPLRLLKHLALGGCVISGDVAGLAPLVRLRHLDLFDTLVEGDVRRMSDMRELRYLNLIGSRIPCPEGCSIWQGSHGVLEALGGAAT